MEAETIDKWKGKPMSEKELLEHKKSFSDIEECIEALYKTENRAYNKEIKLKRRNRV